MNDLNEVILIGNIGGNPEYHSEGVERCHVSLATTKKWQDKSTGEQKEATEWHNLVFWRKQAEIANDKIQKGSRVMVRGELKTNKYTDKNTGEIKYSTQITVKSFEVFGERPQSKSNDNKRENTDISF